MSNRMSLAPARTGAALLLAALLAGCVSAADCDPSRTNVFSAAACGASGAAQEREDQKVAQAETTEARALALQNEVQMAKAELQVRRKERQSLDARLLNVDKDLVRMRNVLENAQSIESVNRQRLSALQAQLGRLQRERSAMTSPSSAEIAQMEREAEAMFEEMDALLGVSSG